MIGRIKTNRTWLVVLMVVAFNCIFTTGCDNRDDWDERVLAGKWWSVDDPSDIVCLEFYRNHKGLCSEDDFYNGYTEDYFTWFVDDGLIHIVFMDGSSWIWDYDLYDGHTVNINGRLFSRNRNYYSKHYIKGKIPSDTARLQPKAPF